MTLPGQGLDYSNIVHTQWNGINSATTNTGGAIITMGNPINITNITSGLGYDYTYTTNTTSTGIFTLPNYKKCRNCNHAHLKSQSGCIETIGFSNSVYFTICSCKEYVPQDNLEYLEWLVKKQEKIK